MYGTERLHIPKEIITQIDLDILIYHYIYIYLYQLKVMEKAKKFSYVNDFPNPLEELHQFYR